MTEEKGMVKMEEVSITNNVESDGKSFYMLAASFLIGAILIAASIIYSASYVVKNLNSQIVSGQQQAANNAPTAQAPSAQPTGPVNVAARSDQPTLGNANAKVTIVEFGDFQCPFCKQYYQQTFSQIKTKYIDTGKVKYVFRHFPLTQIHVNAQISAEAAECANQQGKFWDFHNILYTQGQSDGTGLDKVSLEKYADQLGLNKGTLGFGKNKFNQCLESNATLKTVQADQAEGSKDGVNGTPTFFINGKILVGAQPFESNNPQATPFEPAIEAALK